MKGIYYATSRYLGLGWIFVYCLACFSNNALAVTWNTHLDYTLTLTTGNLLIHQDKLKACKTAVNAHAKQTVRIVDEVLNCNPNVANNSLYTDYKYHTVSNPSVFTHTQLVVGIKTADCPAGSTVNYPTGNPTETPAPQCIGSCPAGTTFNSANGGSCDDDCKPLTGVPYKGYFFGSAVPDTVCAGSCDVTVREGLCAGSTPLLGNKPNCYANGVYSGTKCNSQNNFASDPPNPEQQCLSSGKSFVTVNGVTSCMAKGSIGSTPVTSQQKDTKSTSSNTSTSDQSSTVSDNGDTVTKNTTKQNPDGSSSTETTTQTKSSFCEENPNSQLCKASEDLCEKNPDIPACKEWCDKAENTDKLACQDLGEPDEGTDLETNEVALNFNPAVGGGGSCPADIPMPHNIPALPVHAICDQAAIYRPFVLLFSSLAAAYIIFGYRNKE